MKHLIAGVRILPDSAGVPRPYRSASHSASSRAMWSGASMKVVNRIGRGIAARKSRGCCAIRHHRARTLGASGAVSSGP
ncbi:hypothetical protein [Paenibacillus chitinolyticus]|uniref:hypothetical protein n=1 Tax=Paenibacillus chitinolyticus TaxID=79263 RepID=UPI00295EAC37|nr:hypothetical protein [Paenibacillus chitinolyticus]